ncbi:phage minor head protein [Kluyvera cryocrescens]|uniref:phage minor head protein n=1 Tax=Kluyvera cryocrescens TaxID=580 RepID=UPI0039F6008B
MAQAVDLAYAARLPPKEAVSYFRAKGHNVTWNWYEQLTDAHARAFTVAKAVRLDVLNTLRDEVDRAVHDGITRQEFTRTLAPRLQKLGWWGKQIVVDTEGNAKEIELGSPRRLATIYNVNMRTAYNSGRYAQMMNNVEDYPFWQYVAVMDGRTRPEHAALNGLVFRYDDPFWKTHYPPNGWNCRCRVRALSAERMKALGLKVSYGASFVHTHDVDAGIDETTGEIFRTESTTFDNGRVKMTPDVGWSYNPGSAAFGTDQTLIRKVIETRDPQLREQVIQSLNNSRERQLAFSVWAKRTLTNGRAGEAIQTLGFMSESVAAVVRARVGAEPARLLAISEKGLSDAVSAADPKLSDADVQQLPALMAQPQAVLWDSARNVLMYVTPADDAGQQIVIRTEPAVKNGGDLLDQVVSLSRASLSSLQSAVNAGSLEVIEGRLGLEVAP